MLQANDSYKRTPPPLNLIQPSRYCDSSSPAVRFAAEEITASANSSNEKAVRLFDWVRDNIKYTVGLYKHKASETFKLRHGSCTNKANLLVAMLRSLDIPAAFHMYRVRTQMYFGPLCSRRLTQFMSSDSFHFLASVFLNDTWIQIDPTDDDKISCGGAHLNPQCVQARFDGKAPALLNLDRNHILYESTQPIANVDDVLEKKSRLNSDILWIMNEYLGYVRSHGKYLESVSSFEKSFFKWLELTHPDKYQKFCLYEQTLRKDLKEKPLIDTTRLGPNRSMDMDINV